MTCLKAECGDHITKERFKLASQIICDRVPVLKDVKPLDWPKDEEFNSSVSDLLFFSGDKMIVKGINNYCLNLYPQSWSVYVWHF